MVALPLTSWAVMVTPDCPALLPDASRNCTEGCTASSVPACAADDGSVVSASAVGTPAVSVMGLASTGARVGAEKRIVKVPTVPVSVRPVNVAIPEASVLAVAPLRLAPVPETSEAVTTTPARATGLFCASRSRTAGCTGIATPFCTDAEGWVTTESCVAEVGGGGPVIESPPPHAAARTATKTRALMRRMDIVRARYAPWGSIGT